MTQITSEKVASTKRSRIFIGRIIHSKSLKKLEIIPFGALGIDLEGRISFVRVLSNSESDKEIIHSLRIEFASSGFEKAKCIRLKPLQFLFPGLIDTHLHAPQYPNLAIGMEGDLLEWVRKYTDPIEASYKDSNKARIVYERLVKATLAQGSTCVGYNSTIHVEATNALTDACVKYGQRANVGKMACLVNSTHGNFESSTEKSLADTEECIKYIQELQNSNDSLVTACVQPRGGPFCPPELMTGLGRLSQKYRDNQASRQDDFPLRVQAHMCEAPGDTDLALKTHPGFKHYTDLYKHYGLLHSRSILAHCIHLSDHDIDQLVKMGAGVAHNPNSNTCLRDGECRVRQLLDRGVKVGLGTDCSAGYSISILDAMRQASNVSRHLAIRNQDDRWVLGFEDIVYLATMGGAQVMGLEDCIGNFEVGKSFDALLIDVSEGTINYEGWEDDPLALVKKWVFMGDDRSIQSVFVQGKLVSGSQQNDV